MRTKWQFGNSKTCESLKGNRFFGDDLADSREILLNLSRKLYPVHYPIIHIFKGENVLGQIRHTAKKEI